MPHQIWRCIDVLLKDKEVQASMVLLLNAKDHPGSVSLLSSCRWQGVVGSIKCRIKTKYVLSRTRISVENSIYLMSERPFGFPETFPTFNIPDHSRQCDWLPTSHVGCHLSSPLRPSVHASQVFSSVILYPSCRAAILGRTWPTSQKNVTRCQVWKRYHLQPRYNLLIVRKLYSRMSPQHWIFHEDKRRLLPAKLVSLPCFQSPKVHHHHVKKRQQTQLFSPIPLMPLTPLTPNTFLALPALPQVAAEFTICWTLSAVQHVGHGRSGTQGACAVSSWLCLNDTETRGSRGSWPKKRFWFTILSTANWGNSSFKVPLDCSIFFTGHQFNPLTLRNPIGQFESLCMLISKRKNDPVSTLHWKPWPVFGFSAMA